MIATGRQGTGTRATRALGLATLVGLGWVVVFGLLLSPADVVQGESVRYLYLHVPSVYLAFLAFGVTAFGSVMYLWKRTRSLAWDRLAGASAEIGVFLTALCLLTGALWGKETWGTYWTWDARLTTTALLLLLFMGYLALRGIAVSPEVRARRCAVAGIIAFLDVPIVYKSVEWWRTLHQGTSIRARSTQIDGLMLFSLFVGIVAFTTLFAWLLIHRLRVAVLEDMLDEQGLDAALAERRAEGLASGGTAVAPGSTTGAGR